MGIGFLTSYNLEGVALWRLIDPQEKAKFRFPLNYINILIYKLKKQVGKEIANRIFCYEYVLETHYKLIPYPHWYFYNIGIDPNFQGKGYASKLIKPMLRKIDGEQLHCYLDTNDEKNLPIYHHFGFKILKKFQIPGLGVTNWSMLRKNPN